jgi:hypothetical protein
VLKHLSEVSSHSLLRLYSALAYTLWGLGAFLGIIAVLPRVLELKGQPAESLTVFGITAAILVLTVGCVLSLNRLNRELELRFRQS